MLPTACDHLPLKPCLQRHCSRRRPRGIITLHASTLPWPKVLEDATPPLSRTPLSQCYPRSRHRERIRKWLQRVHC